MHSETAVSGGVGSLMTDLANRVRCLSFDGVVVVSKRGIDPRQLGKPGVTVQHDSAFREGIGSLVSLQICDICCTSFGSIPFVFVGAIEKSRQSDDVKLVNTVHNELASRGGVGSLTFVMVGLGSRLQVNPVGFELAKDTVVDCIVEDLVVAVYNGKRKEEVPVDTRHMSYFVAKQCAEWATR